MSAAYKYTLVLLIFCISFCSLGFRPLNTIKSDRYEDKADAAYQAGDYKNAFIYYKNAADLGNSYCQFMTANMYLEGKGTETDLKKAIPLMKESADSGYPPANYSMGLILLSEATDQKGGQMAAPYFEKAAAQEHSPSMYMLGLIYARGFGVKKDTTEAVRWFRLAKAQGFPVDEKLLSPAGVRTFAHANLYKEMVREIQQRLIDLGYNPGVVDGLYGKNTSAAIKAFQQDHGLAVNGRASEKLLYHLREAE